MGKEPLYIWTEFNTENGEISSLSRLYQSKEYGLSGPGFGTEHQEFFIFFLSDHPLFAVRQKLAKIYIVQCDFRGKMEADFQKNK